MPKAQARADSSRLPSASPIPQVPQALPKGIYRRLFVDTAKPHLLAYGVVALLLLATSASTAGLAWIMEDVVDAIWTDQDRAGPGRQVGLAALALGIVALFALRGTATFGSAILIARIGNQIVADLQARVFIHLQRQDLAFFETHTLGDIAVRFSSNASAARSAVELIVQSVGRDVVTLIGLLSVMALQSPGLAMTGLVVLPPSALALRWLMGKARAVSKDSIAANARMIGQLRDVHQGVRVIKSFTLEPKIETRMADEIHRVRDLSNRSVRYASLTAPVLDLIIGLAVGGVIFYAGWRISTGDIQPGSVVSFLTALLLAYEPARRLARFQVQLQAHMVGVEMMFAFLDRQAAEEPALQPTGQPLAKTGIRFQAVQFTYDDLPALNGLDLDCPQGSTTALVGASGAGKSTIFDLILRLRNAQGGTILIGDIPIQQIPLPTLRQSIAVVPQQTFLFDNTLRENIRWGRPDATDAEVEAAARAANAEGFILQDAHGYERWVTDSAGLSGGERQRIAIARALLKDAPILLLDEATAALDAESERLVQGAIATLAQGRTLLVIAHRLSTIRNADRIHVLDAGHIVESGTHDTLIAQQGAYARLIALQGGDRTAPDPSR